MKPSLSTFQRRLLQSAGALAIAAVVAATLAWSSAPAPRVQLGGAWVAQLETSGMRVAVTYGAVDPSGLKGVYRGQLILPPALLAQMGVDTVTDLISDEVVTGPTTSESTGIAYCLTGGVVTMIMVDHSYFEHVSASEKHNTHKPSFYAASADADNDGFPDPGAEPMFSLTDQSVSKRIGR